MIEILKTVDGTIRQLEQVESGCWINICSFDEEDALWLRNKVGVTEDFLEAMRDREEISRVDKDEAKRQTLVIVDFPAIEDEADTVNPDLRQFDTQPLSIVLMRDPDVVITATVAACDTIARLKSQGTTHIDTTRHTHFLLSVLLEVSQSYIESLRVLEKQSVRLERKLRKKQRNSGLMSMLGIEKSLLYLSTSLKGTEATLNAIKGGHVTRLLLSDHELLDDVMIEYQQATEMCMVYTDVITKAMDAFSGVVSNNVNVSMGVLTAITLVLSIPTMVFSFYGMNTDWLPMSDSWIFPMMLSMSLAAIAIVLVYLFRR